MKHQTRVILGGLMGNVVEAYDISICYFLAEALSTALLGAKKNYSTSILMLVFLAYLAKPVGAFILGMLSDRYGRKRVLIGSILIVGLSTTLIGLIPNYQSIGLWSAGLLLTFRIIQSMALGSEFLNSASFLVESGTPEKRGYRGCWPSVGVKVGFLLACGICEWANRMGVALAIDWAWRIPFVLAILTTLAGVYLRRSMPESLAYVLYYAQREKPRTTTIYRDAFAFAKQCPFLLNYAFFASFLSVATGFFFYLYIPLHTVNTTNLSRSFVIEVTSVSLVLVSLLIPIFGWLSDQKDRLKMLGIATTALLVMAYPYMAAIHCDSKSLFFTVQLLISIPCACYYSVCSVILIELFPLQIRCTTLSVIFSIAASLAAGLPPLVSEYLTHITQDPAAPSVIIFILASIVLHNILYLAKYYRIRQNQYQWAGIEHETKLSSQELQLP